MIRTLNDWIRDKSITYEDLFADRLNYDFLEEFGPDTRQNVAHIIKEKYGGLYISSYFETVEEVQDDIHISLRACAWGINKFWKAINIQYSPLDNYDGTETVTTTYGEHKTTNALGEAVTTTDYGLTHSEATNRVNAYNVATAVDSDSSENTIDPKTDKTTSAAKNDTVTSESHVDKVETTKHGNLGVTTSQQMLNAELNIATRNYYEFIAMRVVDDITIPIFA